MGPNVLLTLLVLRDLPPDKSIIMGEEYPDTVFNTVEEVLRLTGILNMLVLNQHRLFVTDVYYFANITKIE